MVGEFLAELGVGNGVGEFGFLGGVVVWLYGAVSVDLIIHGGVWDGAMGLGKSGHCLINWRV